MSSLYDFCSCGVYNTERSLADLHTTIIIIYTNALVSQDIGSSRLFAKKNFTKISSMEILLKQYINTLLYGKH
jgi:hypothetical protein